MFIKSLETKNGYFIDNIDCCYYLSIIAQNVKGVIGAIGCACAEFNVNISCVIQKGDNGDGSATIIVITEECLEKDINNMIKKLQDENNIKITNKIRVL